MDHLMRLLPVNSYLPPAWNGERKYSGLFSLLNPCSGIAGIYTYRKNIYLFIYFIFFSASLTIEYAAINHKELRIQLTYISIKRKKILGA